MKKRMVIIMIGIILIAVSCEKVDNGACDSGKFSETYEMKSPWIYKFVSYTGGEIEKEVVYFSHTNNGKVRFHITLRQENICPDKHVNIDFGVLFYQYGPLINKLPIRVYGEAFWSPVYPEEEVQLFNGIEVLYSYHRGGASIGLKQVFGSAKGYVNLYLTVEFDKQDSFSQDSTFFVNSIQGLYIDCKGDKFE